MRRLQKLSRSMFLAVVGLALGASAAQPWFGASFDEYADGEALSDRGAVGGSWGELPTADAPAVKVTDGDRASLDVQGKSTTNGVTFTAASAAGDISWAMTLPMKFDFATDLEGFTPDGPISFTVAYDDADAFRFAGLPSERLSKLEDSCLEVIASAADGKTVVARNYLLVRRPKGGLAVIVR